MSSQGIFESDDDYRDRIAREANERTIEDATGSAPSKGFFESDDNYRERIAREADEHTIEGSTGSAPSKGFFESDDDYRDRISREADERIVEDSTGVAPSKGFFESEDDYETRVRREANEQTIEHGAGSSPSKGFFESDHDYRSRIAHAAREMRARGRSDPSANSDSNSSQTYGGDSSSNSSRDASGSSGSRAGSIIGFVVLAFVAVVAIAAIKSCSNSSATLAPRHIDRPRFQISKSSEKVEFDRRAELKAFYLSLSANDPAFKQQVLALSKNSKLYGHTDFSVADAQVIDWFPVHYRSTEEQFHSDEHLLVIQPFVAAHPHWMESDFAIVSEFRVVHEGQRRPDPTAPEERLELATNRITIQFVGFRSLASNAGINSK